MIHHNKWLVVTSLMKREVFETLGGFDSELPMYEDWDFWLRAIKAGYTFKKANTYLKYRQRTNSRNRKDDEIKRNTLSLIREKHAES
jgi:GT2 family glycosyltransferase